MSSWLSYWPAQDLATEKAKLTNLTKVLETKTEESPWDSKKNLN